MRAVTQKAFGGPEVLEVVDTERPVPLPAEVLVRVRATAVNPVDAYIRSGSFPLLGDPPFTLGWDVSGIVEEVVPGVTRFEPGDEVYGMPLFPRAANAYAEYVVAPSRQIARKPASLSHVEAAALPLVGLTAWQGLVDAAGVREGDRVLVHGAGGGLGHVAVQIAKARGAHVVATASAGKHAFVRSLGADEVIDYRAADFTEATGGLDVVYDAVGGGYGERSLRVLRPGGFLVTAVDREDTALAAAAAAAGRRFTGITVEPDHTALEALTALVEEGLLRPHVSQVLPLDAAAKAHELVESGRTQGKIVLTP
ncbi:NADP-dependent oxidoreductase [Actinomadura sp. NTSP31]|uniref:NADP-dependent oxidoreductase n=1 Tax=Actinomadura sp. NTSP31 TaxID=1735447 RepID=UPI0035BFEF2E